MRIPNIPCVFITYAKEKCILLAIKKYSSYYLQQFPSLDLEIFVKYVNRQLLGRGQQAMMPRCLSEETMRRCS